MKQQTNQPEFRYVIALASIFALRMLGLFMIFPVFSSYAHQFHGYTPTLLGIALGIYGLTQGLLQIPLGLSSDRFGRKPIITIGLLIFAVGSIFAAMSHTIYGIIIGRALQGAGAIGSTLMAMVADLTSEKNRTPAMAIIGMTIAITFGCAMILGPIVSSFLTVKGIFWLTSALALLGIVILYAIVPDPRVIPSTANNQSSKQLFISALKDPQLLCLDLGIFIQHAILTASFVVLPILLTHNLLIDTKHQWNIYLPVLCLSFIVAIPFIIAAEKKGWMRQVFLGAILTIVCGQLAISFNQHDRALLTLSLFLFFCGFNLLEACLPSLISKAAPANSKGTAMGIYSCAQFLGIFAGGAIGGWLYGHYQMSSVFYFNVFIALLWFSIAYSMQTVAANRGIAKLAEQ